MSDILLSICIPTYNRAKYLEEAILSIVNQERFQETSEVEIVISDNCSNDNTKEISEKYIRIYGDKIHYYRNSENILDLNFEKALSYGKGLFLKLNNDTLKHQDGSLVKILQTISENKEERNILFFPNGNIRIDHNVLYDNLNSFVENVSFWSGWIGAFGIWREDLIRFKDFNRCSHLQLAQVDVLFRLINSKNAVFVNNDNLFTALSPSNKGGYDILTVFLDNYIFLLTEQLNNKKIERKTFESEKRKLLLKFIRSWLVHAKVNPEVYNFERNNIFRHIFYYYKRNLLTFIKFLLYYYLSFFFNLTKKRIHKNEKKNNSISV